MSVCASHVGSVRVARPFVLWLTGLPCAGKTTLAESVYNRISEKGIAVELLDGDAVRKALNAKSFTAGDRNLHIRQMGFLASRLEHHSVPVIASFVSPYSEARNFVRQLCRTFIEVYVSTPLPVCEARDVKGMYRKARAGEISHFTGIDDAYEPPLAAELTVDTSERSLADCTRQIESYLFAQKMLELT